MVALIGVQAFARDFPATVQDKTGHSVTMEKKPVKIISLGAASTEILYAVGAEKQIAAVADVSNYPESAKKLPKIGGFDAKTISLEKIVAFRPDLIIIYSGMHDFLIPSFEKFKIPYYVSNDATVSDVIDEIMDIAILTGHKSTGSSLVKKYNKIVEDISKATKSSGKDRPNVFWEVCFAHPPPALSPSSFLLRAPSPPPQAEGSRLGDRAPCYERESLEAASVGWERWWGWREYLQVCGASPYISEENPSWS